MIPDDLYENYSTALTENDRQCRAALAAIMWQLDPTDVDAVRDTLLDAYPALVKLYGERAAQVALVFYDDVREAQGITVPFYAYVPADEVTSAHMDATSDVRREIGALYSGEATFGAFSSTMEVLASKRTMGLADSTLHQLAYADPANPKVALVPHPGACGWCVMIGSRGFTNAKKAMEHMRHDGCKCTTVVDFDRKNPALFGYDPKALYDVFSDVNTSENQHKWFKEWQEMGKEERAKYVRRIRTKDGGVREKQGDWSTYVRNRTVQEMNVALGRTKQTMVEKQASKPK